MTTNEPLIFKFNFNKDVTEKQLKLNFSQKWEKYKSDNFHNLYIALPILLLGSFLVYLDSIFKYFILLVGFYFLFKFFYYFNSYFISKRSYLSIIENHLNKYKGTFSTWEFHDDFFKYTSDYEELKYTWTKFEGYRIIEDNLFLDLYEDAGLSFILSKEEIGNENFKKVIAFLKENLK